MCNDKQRVMLDNIQRQLNTYDCAEQVDDKIVVSFYSGPGHRDKYLVLRLWVEGHVAKVVTSVCAPVYNWCAHAATWKRANELLYFHNLIDAEQ